MTTPLSSGTDDDEEDRSRVGEFDITGGNGRVRMTSAYVLDVDMDVRTSSDGIVCIDSFTIFVVPFASSKKHSTHMATMIARKTLKSVLDVTRSSSSLSLSDFRPLGIFVDATLFVRVDEVRIAFAD